MYPPFFDPTIPVVTKNTWQSFECEYKNMCEKKMMLTNYASKRNIISLCSVRIISFYKIIPHIFVNRTRK